MQQQSLFIEQASSEMKFLQSIQARLEHEVTEYAGDPSIIRFVQNANYVSVMVGTSFAFSIRLQGKLPFISIQNSNTDLVPVSANTRKSTSQGNHTQILLGDAENISNYVDFMVEVIKATVDRYPSDWNCCSRYMECSDAKHCIHPDRKFALSCGYQKILRSGRIFYGKNRNID